ncbi:hypothetical protein ETN89_19945 (plasmid) [Photobacterium damselae subsp. damselae]|uniref:ApeA N-terminal domain 1-containing protein n=1 Tax=Photobacterium damselae TaxID=38293 RepID=UPI000A2FE35C|nr:HEPN domain-containing protein [Photobacterium damselae]ARR51774.1 hypothetical protein CAY62_20370 [Photobacterium damselae subsp. damselae]QAY37535.1 hypothetical protein ETN89_19945 [Photobacterium damselae subsp. damselae]
MRIEEEYAKTGYFWLPGQEDKKVPGILTIKDGGNIELEIVGLIDNSIKTLNGNDNLSRIIGYVEKDGFVTLDDCFYTTKNISFGSISKSKLHVHKVLSGVAYNESDILTFNTLSFSVDCLDEWVGISGINVHNDWKNKTGTISYIPPENISYMLNNGMKLEICFAYTLPGFPHTTEAKITQRTYFKLSSEALKPLDDFIDIAYKLTTFLCFAIDTTVALKNVSATSSLQTGKFDGKENPIQIKIFYQSIPFADKIPSQSWHNMLFTYGTIKNNTQDVFNNWLNAYEVISPAFNLYFSTKNGAQKYLDGKFLALAQGLETYHRRTSGEQLMDPSEFTALISTISENCPEQHIDWLRGRLKYGNEINLSTRLKRIIEPFKDKLGDKKNRKKILRQIVDTRNYLTHYNEDLKNNYANGADLWNLCQKMEVIFQLHFLKVLGFNNQEIDSVVENCHPLKNKINIDNKEIK